jgi:hypothetical protein
MRSVVVYTGTVEPVANETDKLVSCVTYGVMYIEPKELVMSFSCEFKVLRVYILKGPCDPATVKATPAIGNCISWPATIEEVVR